MMLSMVVQMLLLMGVHNITSVSDSCNNSAEICHSVSYNGGNITSIVNSCNDAERACYGAAFEGAIEGGILNGCNSKSICEFL